VSEMRSHLQQTLPEYMTPSFFIILPEMPLTPNGKLDRRALPPPDESRPESEEAYVPPQTPEQEILAAVWMSVLGLERIGIRDNFFNSGGDSIRSLQVRIRAQQRGLSFSLQQLFQHQTIEQLARALDPSDSSIQDSRPNAFDLISHDDRLLLPHLLDDAYPLASLQAGMLFHSEFSIDTAAYHDVFSFHLKGHLDTKALDASVQSLAQRHPILRTSFDLTSFTQPLQLVHSAVNIPVRFDDLSHLD